MALHVTKILFVYFFLACILTPAMTFEKRSDDVSFQALMTLVQQQGKMIEQQAATLTSLQDQVRGLTSTVSQEVHTITNLTRREGTRVSFTARMRQVEVTLNNSPFLFDDVVTNVGDAFCPATGVFTAPASGLYLFYAQVMNHANSHRVDWGIFTSSSMLCLNAVDFDPTAYDKSSCLATATLNKGQQVFVRKTNAGTTIEGNVYTSFSGFLLSADV